MIARRHLFMYVIHRLWVVITCFTICHIAVASDFSDVPSQSFVLGGYGNRDSVELRLSQLPLHDIEGIWQLTEDGAFVVIERVNSNKYPGTGIAKYQMIVLESPRLSIRPGTVMGYVALTAKQDCYDAYVYTDFDGGTVLSNAERFTLTLKDSRLQFKQYKSGIKINLWRFVPYMFRYSVKTYNERPKDLDGCIKIYPLPSTPIYPRYL